MSLVAWILPWVVVGLVLVVSQVVFHRRLNGVRDEICKNLDDLNGKIIRQTQQADELALERTRMLDGQLDRLESEEHGVVEHSPAGNAEPRFDWTTVKWKDSSRN